MTTFLKVLPAAEMINARVRVPASKPETQRALIVGALAHGTSSIIGDLRCSETLATKNAITAIGARIKESPDRIEITGVGNKPVSNGSLIDCAGSGFAFRVMSVISSFCPGKVTLTGDSILQGRIMKPLFDAITTLGGDIRCLKNEGSAPIDNVGTTLRGGVCSVPGDTCSQFTTALLLGLPLADKESEIRVTGDIVSASYVRQTLEAMQLGGMPLESTRPSDRYRIQPWEYQPFTTDVSGDFTSASYILAIAALYKCDLRLEGLTSRSIQGEFAIVDFVRRLGLSVEFDDERKICHVSNAYGELRGDHEFNVKDCPNILPTLAAISAYVDGRVRVTGGSVTNFHKSPRIAAIISELKKLGVDISPVLTEDGVLDGFECYGKSSYEGGVQLSSWKDHRIFLSLFIASLRTRNANTLDGHRDVHCSFPDFFEQVVQLGIAFSES